MTPTVSLSSEPISILNLLTSARDCFETTFSDSSPISQDKKICTVAPGRVNLIGEHTDYTGGYVFPMAIEFSTVCYGYGTIHTVSEKSPSPPEITCEIISVNQTIPSTVSFSTTSRPTPKVSKEDKWANYVIGVVAQYLDWMNSSKNDDDDDDDDDNACYKTISFRIAIAGNVPLGSGLSSSASLEVSVATFIECLLIRSSFQYTPYSFTPKDRALFCQKSEHEFCNTPCGIMDQYISSAACSGSALLIDCRSLEYQLVTMGSCDNKEEELPVFFICNSHVTHSNSDGEYPKRVAQCKEATLALQGFYTNQKIDSLRDATEEMVWGIQSMVDSVIFRRAKHVVTENQRYVLVCSSNYRIIHTHTFIYQFEKNRVLAAKIAMESGDWLQLGTLMNASHLSMKIDYETSCEEIDILVDLAQGFDGVYGSRLTGGGFGGCTVSLVRRNVVESLSEYIQAQYKARTGLECSCFVTHAGPGARIIQL